jgi:hypothetical protein
MEAVMFMKISNKDSHGSLLKGSREGLVIINKKLNPITTTEPMRGNNGSITVGEAKEEVVLLWQKQIHENYVINHMKGGDARNRK